MNQGIKRLVRRPRPSLRTVPVVRRVNVAPLTTSFPSGHAASAAAFASGVAVELPLAGPPLAALATAVGGSRVYVGVHYPVDVLVGAGIGAGVAQLTRRLWPVLPARADEVPPSADRRRLTPNPDGGGVVVVANPGAGSGRDDDLGERVSARLPRARIVQPDDGGQLDRVLEQAAADCEVLGVAGGDGSIAAAAEIAIGCSRPVLVLPAGTLNHLARDLRVQSADDAIDALAAGEAVGIDVATIDDRPFLNTAGFGAYAEMLATGERLKKRIGRWPGQLVAFTKTLLDAKPLDVEVDGRRRAVWMGFVGNCRHEPAGLGPSWRPRLDDGLLDVRLLLADLPRSRAKLMLAVLSGRLTSSAAYVEYSARELRVKSAHRKLRLARDGEHFDGPGSFVIRKLPKRLTVYARHQGAAAASGAQADDRRLARLAQASTRLRRTLSGTAPRSRRRRS